MWIESPGPQNTGDPSASGPDIRRVLDRFAEEAFCGQVRFAERWIKRLGIDERGLTAPGAVDAAWALLCELIRDGRIPPDVGREQLEEIFRFFWKSCG